MNYGTVNLIEITWTVAALPGLAIWLANRRTARRSLLAVKALGVGNGRLVVARYSVRKANVLIMVLFVFALIGFVSMVRPSNPEVAGWDWIRVLLTVGLLGAPALLSWLGWEWRQVDQQIISMARDRRGPRTK